jgi:hypothetical protein
MKVLDPLRSCAKVADYCDPSFVGTLHALNVRNGVESTFVTISEQFAIADHFILFW